MLGHYSSICVMMQVPVQFYRRRGRNKFQALGDVNPSTQPQTQGPVLGHRLTLTANREFLAKLVNVPTYYLKYSKVRNVFMFSKIFSRQNSQTDEKTRRKPSVEDAKAFISKMMKNLKETQNSRIKGSIKTCEDCQAAEALMQPGIRNLTATRHAELSVSGINFSSLSKLCVQTKAYAVELKPSGTSQAYKFSYITNPAPSRVGSVSEPASPGEGLLRTPPTVKTTKYDKSPSVRITVLPSTQADLSHSQSQSDDDVSWDETMLKEDGTPSQQQVAKYSVLLLDRDKIDVSHLFVLFSLDSFHSLAR
jgi:hypothetical protein